ncbi:unnamed protein product [Caenorhabditis angaria]|uniref:Uncharacterized protein n=1 Tax=Caenorhabditis angaria TaxID=860376 RepID=A0A9P1N9W0_9PELO|nr:unnamed protein product [Caenorhabditis angaria]
MTEQKPTDRIDRNFVYRLGLLTSSEKKKNKRIKPNSTSSSRSEYYVMEYSPKNIHDHEIKVRKFRVRYRNGPKKFPRVYILYLDYSTMDFKI